MAKSTQNMRAALISLPVDSGQEILFVAGKTMPERQLDFALSAGCKLIILHGQGSSPQGLNMRHLAERAGARFQSINNVHSLIGMIDGEDSLLVLQPQLLSTCVEVRDILAGENTLLVVSSGPGQQVGMERIDLDRAWAGALCMPGKWLSALDSLPSDVDPAPALLRISLQRKLAETRIADSLLDDGEWCVISSQRLADAAGQAWVEKLCDKLRGPVFSGQIARVGVKRMGLGLLGLANCSAYLLSALLLLLGASIALACFQQQITAFVLLAFATPLAWFEAGLARLARAPFLPVRPWPWPIWLLDGALAVCVASLLWDDLLPGLFATFVLVSGLLMLDRYGTGPAARILRDRGVVCLLAGLGLIFLAPEHVIMGLSSLVLLANIAKLAWPASEKG